MARPHSFLYSVTVDANACHVFHFPFPFFVCSPLGALRTCIRRNQPCGGYQVLDASSPMLSAFSNPSQRTGSCQIVACCYATICQALFGSRDNSINHFRQLGQYFYAAILQLIRPQTESMPSRIHLVDPGRAVSALKAKPKGHFASKQGKIVQFTT